MGGARLRKAVDEVAESSHPQPEDVVMRFGQRARIGACVSGGRALASKNLIERLEPDAAAALDLDPVRITYTALRDLSTAAEKARRDAPAIALCEF